MNKKEIIKDLTLFLGNIEGARTISSSDFTDDRIPFMVVVGVESVTQVYPSLPDYELKLNILVDTFITDDEGGEKFNKIICRCFCNIFTNYGNLINDNFVYGLVIKSCSTNESFI